MPSWECHIVFRADQNGAKSDNCQERKREIASACGQSWFFNCPLCEEYESLVAELDEDQIGNHVIKLHRVVCANCDLVVKENSYLANAIMSEDIAGMRKEILQDFGIVEP